jgi:hypothetical protein
MNVASFFYLKQFSEIAIINGRKMKKIIDFIIILYYNNIHKYINYKNT